MLMKFYNDAYFKHSELCDQQLISAACLVLFNSGQYEITYILIFFFTGQYDNDNINIF